MLKYIKLKVISRKFNFVENSVSSEFINQYEPTYFDTENPPQELWQLQPIQFKYTFDVSGNIITSKFTNVTENRTVFQSDVDISIFTKSGIYITELVTENDITSTKAIDLTDLYKNTPKRYFYDKHIVKFLVLQDNPTIDDIIVLIAEPCAPSEESNYRHPDSPVEDISNYGIHSITVDGTAIDSSYVKTVDDLNINSALPTVNTTSTISGDTITVSVSDSLLSQIKLTPTVGYVPKTTIPLVNGDGTFKVLSTGLDAGDTVEVGIGYGRWPNITTFTRTI